MTYHIDAPDGQTSQWHYHEPLRDYIIGDDADLEDFLTNIGFEDYHQVWVP